MQFTNTDGRTERGDWRENNQHGAHVCMKKGMFVRVSMPVLTNKMVLGVKFKYGMAKGTRWTSLKVL